MRRSLRTLGAVAVVSTSMAVGAALDKVHQAGETISLAVAHGPKRQELQVTLAPRPGRLLSTR